METKISTSKKIKIMIAEDHVALREGLAKGLAEISKNIEVIGAAEDGLEVLGYLKRNIIPDVILLDLRMPLFDGNQVLKVLKSDYPSVRAIIFSSTYSDYIVANAIIDGAAAYICKGDGDYHEIVKAIESVYEYNYYFNSIITRQIILQLEKKGKIPYIIEGEKFSKHEIEIIKRICENIPLKQIASDMNISESTLRWHKSEIYRKSKSTTLVSLVKFAIHQGIAIPPNE